jgi:hypothetical protein
LHTVFEKDTLYWNFSTNLMGHVTVKLVQMYNYSGGAVCLDLYDSQRQTSSNLVFVYVTECGCFCSVSLGFSPAFLLCTVLTWNVNFLWQCCILTFEVLVNDTPTISLFLHDLMKYIFEHIHKSLYDIKI